jgi:hypothetical protein
MVRCRLRRLAIVTIIRWAVKERFMGTAPSMIKMEEGIRKGFNLFGTPS